MQAGEEGLCSLELTLVHLLPLPPGRVCFSVSLLVERGVREPWTTRGELDLCASISLGSYLGLIHERQVPQLALCLAERAEVQQTPGQ